MICSSFVDQDDIWLLIQGRRLIMWVIVEQFVLHA